MKEYFFNYLFRFWPYLHYIQIKRIYTGQIPFLFLMTFPILHRYLDKPKNIHVQICVITNNIINNKKKTYTVLFISLFNLRDMLSFRWALQYVVHRLRQSLWRAEV